MSTPDQPDTPPLTRRRLREIRNTGATPVLTPEDIAKNEAFLSEADDRAAAAQRDKDAQQNAHADDAIDTAEPIDADAIESEPQLDSGMASSEPDAAAEPETHVEPDADAERPAETAEPVALTPSVAGEEPVTPASFADLAVTPLTRRQAREVERIRTASVPIIAPDGAPSPTPDADTTTHADEPEAVSARSGDAESGAAIADVPGLVRPSAVGDEPIAVVNPHFGSGLLAGETPVVELPPSFDQLITRTGSTGVSSSTPNALILSQTPAAAPLVAPVTATGEVLITGTFDLPEGLGSVGHAPGMHDGKDVDAVLVDGELPAASSPTPIAASAAISQVRNSDEIIRPPAPEKGGRLLIALTITAGALLVTVAGLLVLAFTTGIF
ncbi:hypothetical protein [Microbacterium sp. A1-JK]|uniref:hypothetical protein n=1 Tax=Microbacterium sp. A1-JK TaxID=3177516 RepID=UPI0038893EF9